MERVCELAKEKKSVEVRLQDWKVMLASFVQNWQARLLYQMIKMGRLREHKKINKK